MRGVGARIVNQCEPLSLIWKASIPFVSLQILSANSPRLRFLICFLLGNARRNGRWQFYYCWDSGANAAAPNAPLLLLKWHSFQQDFYSTGYHLKTRAESSYSVSIRRYFGINLLELRIDCRRFVDKPVGITGEGESLVDNGDVLNRRFVWRLEISFWIRLLLIFRSTSASFKGTKPDSMKWKHICNFSWGKTNTAWSTQWRVHSASNQHILSGLLGASAWQFSLSNG